MSPNSYLTMSLKSSSLLSVPQPQKQQHTSYDSQEKQLGYGQQLPSYVPQLQKQQKPASETEAGA